MSIEPAAKMTRQEQGARGFKATRKCHGKNKVGNPCGRPASKGREFCKLHGGKNHAGVTHYAYKTGEHKRKRYDHSLPALLRDDVERARLDPDIHSLEDEITLAEANLNDVLRRRHEYGDPGKGWTTLLDHWRLLRAYQTIGDIAGSQREYAAIGPLLERMQTAHMLDAEIREQIRLVSQLRMQEHKRLLDLRNTIPPEAFMGYLKEIQLTIRRIALEQFPQLEAERYLHAVRESVGRIEVRRLVGVGTSQPIDITPQTTLASAQS